MNQLLTPALRAKIEAVVRRALQDLPPGITPASLVFLEWLESLIRYYAAHPLDPAAEKPPVLGGVGVADKYANHGPVCGTFLHGLVDLRNPDTLAEDGYINRVVFSTDPDGNGVWERGNWENSTEMVGVYGGSSGCVPLGHYPGSPTGVPAGCHSGRMRELVQLQHGQLEPVPYQACWAVTHGIWIGADDSWWVIEVDVANGVTAWPAPKCRVLSQEEQDRYGIAVPYIPALEDIPASEDRTELLDADDMAALEDYAAVYALSAWSFNQDGRKAVNTAQSIEDVFKRSSLWSLDISGENSPASATLSNEEEEYLFAKSYSAQLKYPKYIDSDLELITLETVYDTDGEEPPSRAPAPLRAFYDRDDQLVVIRLAVKEGGETITLGPLPGFEQQAQCPSDLSSGSGWARRGHPYLSVDVTTRDREYIQISVDGEVITSEPDNDFEKKANSFSFYSWSAEQNGGWNLGDFNWVYEEHWELTVHERGGSSGYDQQKINQSVCILPLFESTKFYHYEGERITLENAVNAHRRGSRVFGKVYKSFLGGNDAQDEKYCGELQSWYSIHTPIEDELTVPGRGGSSELTGPPQQHDDGIWYVCQTGKYFLGGICLTSSFNTETFDLIQNHSLSYYSKGELVEMWIEEAQTAEEIVELDGRYAAVATGEGDAQQMVMHYDAHSDELGIISDVMNGLQFDLYRMLGGVESIYPLDDLTESNLRRAWFGGKVQ